MKRSTVSVCGTSLIRSAGVAVVIVAVFALSSCTRGSQGIFATIEVEEETKTSNLVDDTSATALVRADLGDTDRFIVRAGTKIFTRQDGLGAEWSAISAPSGYLPVFLAGIDTDSPTDGTAEEVYAVYFDPSNNRDYLYKATVGDGGVSWSPISTGAVWDPAPTDLNGDTRITGFESVGDRIAMSVLTTYDDKEIDDTHIVRTFADGPSDSVELGDFANWDNDSRGIQDAATVGGITVILGAEAQYTTSPDTAGSLQTATTTVEHGRGVTAFPSSFKAGEAVDTDTFLVVTIDGKLFTSTDGNNWTEASLTNISDRSFSGVAWVEHKERLVVGTVTYRGTEIDDGSDARGYYEVDVATPSSEDGSFSFSFSNDDISDNYVGSELATTGIARFRYYSADNPGEHMLFALTHGKGLWRTAYEPGGPEWAWE